MAARRKPRKPPVPARKPYVGPSVTPRHARGDLSSSKVSSGAASTQPPTRAWIVGAVLLLVAGLITFGNSLTNAFVHDDVAIQTTPALHQLSTAWQAITVRPGAPFAGRPVVALSLAVNHALGGLNPQGYHAANIAIHLLAAFVLFGVLRLTLLNERLAPRFAADADLVAGGIAILWMVHPLQTEAVNYISQRTESLMGLFYLLTLYAAIRAGGNGPPRAWWTTGSIVACALGMMCKESMVTAPFMVWLYDRVFIRARRGRLPLYAGLAATWLVLVWLMKDAPRADTVGASYGVSMQTYALNQAAVILHYLRLTFWPFGLAVDYGPTLPIPFAAAAPGLLVLGVIGAATLVALVRRSPLGFVGAWFFVTLAPSSSVIPIVTEVGAERRMYLALAAIVTAVVVGIYTVIARPEGRAQVPDGAVRRPDLQVRHSSRHVAFIGAMAALAMPLMTISMHRNADYRTEEQLWRTSVAARPTASAYNNLGVVLTGNGKFAEAIPALKEAVRLTSPIDPRAYKAHQNLAYAYIRTGEQDAAIPEYREWLRLYPGATDAYLQLGNALIARERWAEAIDALQKYVAAKPADGDGWAGLALADLSAERIPDAIRDGRRAAALKPGDPLVWFNLGVALSVAGERAESATAFERATRLDPAMRDAIDSFRAPR